jgi:hypothetical protein
MGFLKNLSSRGAAPMGAVSDVGISGCWVGMPHCRISRTLTGFSGGIAEYYPAFYWIFEERPPTHRIPQCGFRGRCGIRVIARILARTRSLCVNRCANPLR